VHIYIYIYIYIYTHRCAPVSVGNVFNDLSQLHETADNTERYI
jgi:hypothetical protein